MINNVSQNARYRAGFNRKSVPFKGNWLNLKLKRNPVSSSSSSFIIILTVEVDSFFLMSENK